GSFSEFLVELAHFFFASFTLGDVVVSFQDRDRDPLLVSLQGPSAGHYHSGSIRLSFLEFALPAAVPQQIGGYVVERCRKNGPQEIVRALSDRFLGPPPVKFLSAAIPVCDDVAHVADKNCVMCEIKQAGLLRSHGHFLFEFVAGL